MEGKSGLSELSVISWASAFEGCPLGGVPLYTVKKTFGFLQPNFGHCKCMFVNVIAMGRINF